MNLISHIFNIICINNLFRIENEIEHSVLNHHVISKTSSVKLPQVNLDELNKILTHGDITYIGSQKGEVQTESVLNFHDLTVNKINKAINIIIGDSCTFEITLAKFTVSLQNVK